MPKSEKKKKSQINVPFLHLKKLQKQGLCNLPPGTILLACLSQICHSRAKLKKVLISLTNEFMVFASYATIILSKIKFMSTTTVFHILTQKIFVNLEGCVSFEKGENKKYLPRDGKRECVQRHYFFLLFISFIHDNSGMCYIHNYPFTAQFFITLYIKYVHAKLCHYT
uniref:Uncharacterized protein n=1 Tax=Marmota marmota marmota TaxID=9994 RepID=A0A8C6A6U9_MARMA